MPTVQIGDWSIKASSFDDQLLILAANECKMETHFKIFYCEEQAHTFVEGLINNDKSNQAA